MLRKGKVMFYFYQYLVGLNDISECSSLKNLFLVFTKHILEEEGVLKFYTDFGFYVFTSNILLTSHYFLLSQLKKI